ncbi:MAG: nucleotide sugar dehydrogenase [Syntrophales bacterium]|jgi:UDP-N-acetyl-D-glucosamine dehydrogenase|nr:nucleotide sugar dehydrogenase [Syntrophales bacterium]MCK9528056.1 nucleotide sugar dehydrogenase [Syntrophales bacterium]MDX9922348.1 nucleotide sugar dehydrogenase [Syntrophales bacterium]
MELVERITSKQASVGVIGLGYVGLPLVIEFARSGFPVTGFDVDEEKVRMLRDGTSYIRHVDLSSLTGDAATRFVPTTDFSLLETMDCILICVPTPLNRNREPDMRYVEGTTRALARYLRPGQLVVLESTTYPGTTDEMVRTILEAGGLKAGTDFYLAYSPEREDPNNRHYSLRTVPKVVGGYTARCLAVVDALYSCVVERTVPVSSTKVAEASKLLENIYRSVNIALVNELKMLFERMGIDTWEVIEAAKTKPFGFQAFYPGPGLGGHCIPIDPFYLTWKAREYGMATRFIELAGEINTAMPDYVVSRVMVALNERGKALKGARIHIMGLAYKANVDDARESPTYHLMEKLEALGAMVAYHDPYIPVILPSREFSEYAGRRSRLPDADCDAILIVTPHDEYRTMDFAAFGVPVVDTRNIVQGGRPWLYKA